MKEKEQAHKEYREAISKGHGAYLMDEETPVSIIPLSCPYTPPLCSALLSNLLFLSYTQPLFQLQLNMYFPHTSPPPPPPPPPPFLSPSSTGCVHSKCGQPTSRGQCPHKDHLRCRARCRGREYCILVAWQRGTMETGERS